MKCGCEYKEGRHHQLPLFHIDVMQLSTISLIVYKSGTFVQQKNSSRERVMIALESVYNYYFVENEAPMEQTDV